MTNKLNQLEIENKNYKKKIEALNRLLSTKNYELKLSKEIIDELKLELAFYKYNVSFKTESNEKGGFFTWQNLSNGPSSVLSFNPPPKIEITTDIIKPEENPPKILENSMIDSTESRSDYSSRSLYRERSGPIFGTREKTQSNLEIEQSKELEEILERENLINKMLKREQGKLNKEKRESTSGGEKVELIAEQEQKVQRLQAEKRVIEAQKGQKIAEKELILLKSNKLNFDSREQTTGLNTIQMVEQESIIKEQNRKIEILENKIHQDELNNLKKQKQLNNFEKSYKELFDLFKINFNEENLFKVNKEIISNFNKLKELDSSLKSHIRLLNQEKSNSELFQNDIKRLKSKLENRENEIKELRKKLRNNLDSSQPSQTSLKRKEREIDDLKLKIKRLEREIDDLNKKIRNSQDELRRLRNSSESGSYRNNNGGDNEFLKRKLRDTEDELRRLRNNSDSGSYRNNNNGDNEFLKRKLRDLENENYFLKSNSRNQPDLSNEFLKKRLNDLENENFLLKSNRNQQFSTNLHQDPLLLNELSNARREIIELKQNQDPYLSERLKIAEIELNNLKNENLLLKSSSYPQQQQLIIPPSPQPIYISSPQQPYIYEDSRISKPIHEERRTPPPPPSPVSDTEEIIETHDLTDIINILKRTEINLLSESDTFINNFLNQLNEIRLLIKNINGPKIIQKARAALTTGIDLLHSSMNEHYEISNEKLLLEFINKAEKLRQAVGASEDLEKLRKLQLEIKLKEKEIDHRYIPERLNSRNLQTPLKRRLPPKTPDERFYRKELIKSLEPEDSKPLFFFTSSPSKRKRKQLSNEISKSIIKKSSTIYNRTRKISSIPYKILDAPGIEDDFYLNLIDWGKNNKIVVALQNSVYTWNSETGKIEHIIEEDSTISSIKWSPLCNYLSIGLDNSITSIYDIEKQKIVSNWEEHEGRVGSISWKNNNEFSTGGFDGDILHNDLREGKGFKIGSHNEDVCGLKWSLDSNYLASGSNDNNSIIWEKSGLKFILEGHKAAVRALCWIGNNKLVTGGGAADRTIKIWNSKNGEILSNIDTLSQVCAIQYSRLSNELISSHGFSDNQIIIWNLKRNNLFKIKELKGHSERVLHMSISPNETDICTCSSDETIRIWKINSLNDYQKNPSHLNFELR